MCVKEGTALEDVEEEKYVCVCVCKRVQSWEDLEEEKYVYVCCVCICVLCV